ncbi:MAG: fasciclin domain-containing protein [Desulfuromonadaceae bacterium]|nr:fasciclin domain-containing protein [Desulfuromonadaceae bacterium]
MNDILSTLKEDGSFTTLLAALKKAELEDQLNGAGPITLFAPSDQAFSRISIENLMSDPDKLHSTLTYHIVEEQIDRAGIEASESIYTLNGKQLTVHLDVGQYKIDNASPVTTDIRCSNGLIHVIDNVFLPKFSGWYCACC